MLIHEVKLSEQELEENDYRNRLEIHVSFDSPSVSSETLVFNDGEPEDATLNRDFNDCYSIVKLLKLAYEAGLRGEKLNIESNVDNNTF